MIMSFIINCITILNAYLYDLEKITVTNSINIFFQIKLSILQALENLLVWIKFVLPGGTFPCIWKQKGNPKVNFPFSGQIFIMFYLSLEFNRIFMIKKLFKKNSMIAFYFRNFYLQCLFCIKK